MQNITFYPFFALPTTTHTFLEGTGKLQRLNLWELTASNLEDILIFLSLDPLEIFLDENLGSLKIAQGLGSDIIYGTFKKQDHKEYTRIE